MNGETEETAVPRQSALAERMTTISGFIGIAIGAATGVSTLVSTLLNTVSRLSLVAASIACICWAVIAAIKPRKSVSELRDVDGNPMTTVSRNTADAKLWGIALVVLIVWFVVDLGVNLSGLISVAIVDGPMFPVFPRELDTPYQKWPFSPMLPDRAATAAVPFSNTSLRPLGFSDEYLGHLADDVAEFEELRDAADVAWSMMDSGNIDNVEQVGALTAERAASFYTSPLGEHFTFLISQGRRTEHLVIENIVVTVFEYRPLPPPVGGDDASLYQNYIAVVELHRKETDLPWEYNAKYLLDDPATQSVQPWNNVTLMLSDGLPRRFLVKVGARDPGIYTYGATIQVRSGIGGVRNITLIDKDQPRTCLYWEMSDTALELAPIVGDGGSLLGAAPVEEG